MIGQFAYCLSFTAYVFVSLALYTEKACVSNSSFPSQYQTIRSLLGSEILIYASCLYKNYVEYNHYRELKRYTHILNLILPKSM